MLTIVIPTKNEEALLPRLLESIRHQSYQPREIIVADAQSDDATREIARLFGARVVDGGLPAVGRNRGAVDIRTPFVLFLDADVNLQNLNFLEQAMGEMVERELDIATCDITPLSGTLVDQLMHGAYNTYVRTVGRVLPHAPGICIFVRKHLHDEIGGFDESILFCEDHDYARRAAKHGSFGFLSVDVPVSTRRFDRDGRVTVAMKYLLAELHLATLGPIRHDLFHYTFGHSHRKEREQR